MKEILKVELETEFRRFTELENYAGLVLVHPDDVDSVVTGIMSIVNHTEYDVKFALKGNQFSFKDNRLYVRTCSRGKDWHYDYAGLRLSSIIFDQDCFGKNEGNIYKELVPSVRVMDSILYMLSRLHSGHGMDRLVIV